jgi:hypothetical protein
MSVLSRKEALKRISLMIGGAVSAPVASAFLKGVRVRTTNHINFTAEQEKLLSVIADIIIPETDTPGASDAGVVRFISDMVFGMYSDEERNSFMDQLSSFRLSAISELGTAFLSGTKEIQKDYIYKIHETAYSTHAEHGAPWSFIRTMKELTIVGYFNSEVGMTRVLQYTQTPGEYRACISFEEAGGRVHARDR